MDLQVTRWRRYGKDRLYVSSPSGTNVGWVDLVTGERHLADSALQQSFEAALARHGASPGRAAEATTVVQTVALPPAPVVLVDDLALNVPGKAVLAQAEAARQSAPFLTFLARVFGVHTDERAWRIGGRGEQLVARELAKLDPRWWKQLHSVPVGAGESDIDHVVIGPGGIFTLNTKHHPDASVWVGGDTVLVNGQRQPYVRNSRHEAARAAKILGSAVGANVAVVGVVVVVGAARGMKVKAQPEDGRTFIVARRDLAKWLRRRPLQLTPEQVSRLYAQARNATIWRTKG